MKMFTLSKKSSILLLKVSQLQAVVTKYDEFGVYQMCLCYSRREVYVLETACSIALQTTSEKILKLTHGNVGFPKKFRGSHPRTPARGEGREEHSTKLYVV